MLLLVPIVAMFVVVGVGLFRVRPSAGLGQPAPNFSLPLLHNEAKKVGPANLRGRPAVINFWASWCTPCRQEAPELAQVSANEDRVSFLGVNFLDGRSPALAYEKEFGITFPSVRDTSGRIPKQLYGVTGAPETFFLDSNGRVVGRFIGALPPGRLSQIIDQLVNLRPGAVLDISGRGTQGAIP